MHTQESKSHRPNWATPEQIEKFLTSDQRQRTTSAYEWIGNATDEAVFKREADGEVYERWNKSKSMSQAALKVKGQRKVAAGGGAGGGGSGGKGDAKLKGHARVKALQHTKGTEATKKDVAMTLKTTPEEEEVKPEERPEVMTAVAGEGNDRKAEDMVQEGAAASDEEQEEKEETEKKEEEKAVMHKRKAPRLAVAGSPGGRRGEEGGGKSENGRQSQARGAGVASEARR